MKVKHEIDQKLGDLLKNPWFIFDCWWREVKNLTQRQGLNFSEDYVDLKNRHAATARIAQRPRCSIATLAEKEFHRARCAKSNDLELPVAVSLW